MAVPPGTIYYRAVGSYFQNAYSSIKKVLQRRDADLTKQCAEHYR